VSHPFSTLSDIHVRTLIPDALQALQPLLASLPVTSDTPAPRKKAILACIKAVSNACDKYSPRGKGKKSKQSIDIDDGRTADWLDSEGKSPAASLWLFYQILGLTIRNTDLDSCFGR
jgi:hypothetical protein